MNRTDENLGFPDVLCILFIALKLCNVIDWNWVWVLAPMWISIILNAIVSTMEERRKR